MYKSSDELFGTELSKIETHQIEWLWQRRIPLGKITILDGDPGMGKSFIAMNIAARVSTGQIMPDGMPGIQGGVIIIAPEDSAADTIKPRLEVAGVDQSEVLLMETFEHLDIKRMGIFEYPFSLLTKLAERTSCAILIIRHLNKGSSSNALYRGAGSIGIIGTARMGLIVLRDPNDEQRCILATSKNNLSKHASHLIYRVVENEYGIAYIQWLGETNDPVSNLLLPPTNVSFDRQEIHNVLRRSNGPLEPNEIAERTGQKIESVRVILSRMYDSGEIARPYRGKYTSLDHVTITEVDVQMINEKSDTSVRSDINVINDSNSD